ncbi:MAG: hypothetical protein ACLPTZ_17245 [Beijerinckiaceae bacterium]|jgi:hypothetical protein
MITPSGLGLWLRLDAIEHTDAMIGLIASRDLRVVADGDVFSVERGHYGPVTRFECGQMPALPATIA